MISCLVKHPHPPLTELKLALKWLGLTAKGEDVLKKCQLIQIDILGGKSMHVHVCVHRAATWKGEIYFVHMALSKKGLKVTDLVRMNWRL